MFWGRIRFDQKLIGTLLVVFIFSLLMALFASWATRHAYQLFERSRLAHEVLDGLQKLQSTKYEFLQTLRYSVSVEHSPESISLLKVKERLLIEEIERAFIDTRKNILAEISFVEPGSGENEQDELDTLAEIESLFRVFLEKYREFSAVRDQGVKEATISSLDALTREPASSRIGELFSTSIAHEIVESKKADSSAVLLLHDTQHAAWLCLVSASIFSVVAVYTLAGMVRRPLAMLRIGVDAFGRDQLSHRIPVVGDDEFAELARSFNNMAAELEVRRNEQIAAQQKLEQRIATRTQELLVANRNLEASDSARRRFLADISHELRTPLTIIRGESDVALRGDDKQIQEYKNALRRIQEQASHTADLVDDLLFLARREALELQLKMQPVALGRLVSQTCEEFQTLAELQRIRILFRSDALDSVIMGDSGRLRQLTLICLDNAVRYSSSDQSIDISLRQREGVMELQITDQGIGISREEIKTVFERFYRGAQAQQLYLRGSGLGLPIAKAIAEAHGGSIDIESELGRGTTVTVLIPVASKLRVVA